MKKLAHVMIAGAITISIAQAQVYTDESLYLSALNGMGFQPLIEDFDGSDWDSVRNVTAPSVTSKGITWTGTDQITTSEGPARTGWAVYDHPGGDPDILYGTSTDTLYGIGGWFKTSTPYTNIQIYLDSVFIDNANIQLGTQHVFLGVVYPDGFTNFEIRDTEATPEDQKHWFADDFTFGRLPSEEVPTVSEWGLLIIGLSLLAAGTVAVIRRKYVAMRNQG